MLTQHDTHLWSAIHEFKVRGLAISSRMTVVRLDGDQLWLHSPVPLPGALQNELKALGQVRWLVAPSCAHDLFLHQACDTFPDAEVWVAPGLLGAATVPAGARTMDREALAQWRPSLDGVLIQGMPQVNETLWIHRPSGTLIVTDLLQWWQGPLRWSTLVWAHAMGVRKRVGVSRFFGRFVQDQRAFHHSLAVVSDWPVRRALLCHDAELHWNTPALALADVGQALGLSLSDQAPT